MLTEHTSSFYNYFTDNLGRKQGLFNTYYDNGQKEQHDYFVNDKRHGDSKSYYTGGQLRTHILFINGSMHHSYLCDGPLSAEDKFELCLKYGHLEFL